MGKAKLNIPMCAALVLLFLTMLSIHLTSGLYARYTATSTASDSARVAKFDVRTGLQNDAVTVNCTAADASGEYLITVDNQSEVAVKYTIFVSLTPKAENSAISLNGTDINVYIADEKDTNGNYSFQQGTFNASEMKFTRDQTPLMPGATKEHCLKFEVANWTALTGKVNGAESINWNFEITVRILAEQVD